MKQIGSEQQQSVPSFNMSKIAKKLLRKHGPTLVKIEQTRRNARKLFDEANLLIDNGNELKEQGNFQLQILEATTKELASDMATLVYGSDENQDGSSSSSDE